MTNRGDREEDVWLSDEQLAKLARADDVDTLHSPVPTRMVSNGEHMPIPQTAEQRQVESRIAALAESAGRRLGLGRRRFLAGAGGVAASFLAMNEVYGQFFSVDKGGIYKPLPRDYENRISVPLKALLEYPGLPADKLALARREYLAGGAMPSHTRYGWVHAG